MSEQDLKLSLDAYKGTRDFYPADMAVQNYLFSVMRRVVESYGYAEYAASIIEETALYRAKSGEEIVNEQTYSFIDRGGRDVTIRPEMTPTVARMVAKKRKELTFPIRWYSIPNLLRYERPQRGRLREHWQLNVDFFGSTGFEADIELIAMAHDILSEFGATQDMFEIRINDRQITNTLLRDTLLCTDEESHAVMKLIDRKEKIPAETFQSGVEAILGADRTGTLLERLHSSEIPSEGSLGKVIDALKRQGVTNVVYAPSLMRGFDYYTGTVFEVFDTNEANNRSIFGGGRYNDLVGLFDVEPVGGIGFGLGDVTIRDFLDTHNLLPADLFQAADLYIAVMGAEQHDYAFALGREIRKVGIRTIVDAGDRKLGSQIKTAERAGATHLIVVGGDEVAAEVFKVKHLASGDETEVAREDLRSHLGSLLRP